MTSNLDDFTRAQGISQHQRIGVVFYSSVVLVLALLISLTGWSVYRDYQSSSREVRQNTSALSRALEGYISALLQQSHESIRTLSADLSDARQPARDEAQVLSLLADAMRYDPVSDYLFVLRRGELFAVDSQGRPAARAFREQIRRLEYPAGTQPTFGEAFLLPGHPGYLLPMMIGQTDAQGGRLVVGAVIDTDRIGQLLARLGLEENMNAGMVDGRGVVLYRTPQTMEFVGEPLPAASPIRPLFGQMKPALVEGISIDGQWTLFAVTPSVSFPIYAVVGETLASYQLPWLRRSLYSAVVLVLSVLMTGLAGWQLRRLIHQISRNGQFYRQLFTDVNDGVLLLDAEGRVQVANRRAAQLFGVDTPARLHECHPAQLSPERQPNGLLSTGVVEDALSQLLDGEVLNHDSEWQFRRCDNGRPFDCEVRSSLFRWQQSPMLLLVLHDITERKRYLLEQEFFASHDSLTDLPNRYWLIRHIEQRIAGELPDAFAVLLLDMNRFKEVNDTLGHHCGDAVLQEVGGRLDAWLQSQNAQIARLGGDEMAIVTHGAPDEAGITSLCQGIGQVLRQTVSVGGIQLELSASIGVARYPDHGDNPGDLLRCADIAMYQAKGGRRSFMLYHRGVDNYTPERLALHNWLGRAIREGGLQLHYQPKVRLSDHQVTGFEALLRWEHPERGRIPPSEFIPLAESCELIHPLTHWVIDQALCQLRSWIDRGLDTCIAINISANNLRNPAFVGELHALLERHQVPAGLVELEVTEGTLLEDPEMALQSLQSIRDLGVALSIDDFGTGYSSLAYLKRLPVQVLKIDRTFVSAMSSNSSDAMIVQSTVGLGHNFGMLVVAEGVEDASTAEALTRLGCDIAQGYYFGHPMPAERVMAWCLQRQLESLDLD